MLEKMDPLGITGSTGSTEEKETFLRNFYAISCNFCDFSGHI